MKHEWRRHEKALYGAGKTPELLDVPAQKFIVISGRGDPTARISPSAFRRSIPWHTRCAPSSRLGTRTTPCTRSRDFGAALCAAARWSSPNWSTSL